MDHSTNSGLDPAHVQQDSTNNQYTFLDGIESYGPSNTLQSGNNDFSDFTWDPALFDGAGLGNGFSQPPAPARSPFDPNATGQSHSPALSQYHTTQPTFQQQYQPQIFDSRMTQPGYDARFYPRPSASPVPMEQNYSYQQHMNFQPQTYGQSQMSLPLPRQTTASTLQPTYQPRQQPITPYLTQGRDQAPLSQTQNSDLMQYANFSEPSQQHTHSFVNPSMLNTSRLNNFDENTKFQTHQFIHSPYYASQSSTVDPRSLQAAILSRPTAQAPPQQAFQQQQQQDPTATVRDGPQQPEKPIKVKKQKDPNAPKKPRVKKQKEVLADTQKDGQVSLSDTSDESDSDDEPPEVTPALLVVSQPTDERGKALYNAVQAVWSPRNKPVSADKVRTGVVAFGDTVRALRDSWKTKNDDLKKAELPKSMTAANAPKLKEDVSHYRQVMESVVARSIQFGHPGVVRSLGENQFIMSALYSFLLDRFNVGDYDSTLVGTILQFASKFETVDEEMLEATKWTKILQRFVKKSTGEAKTLSQAILNNAVNVTKRKASGPVRPADGPGGQSSNGAAVGTSRDVVVGVKRSSDGETIAPAAKKTLVKPTVQSSKPLALQNLEKRRAAEAQSKATKALATTTSATSAAPVPKTKVAVTAPPKAGIISTLVTAPKKPAMTALPRQGVVKEESATTSTASLLANMPRIRKEPVKRDSPPRPAPAVPAVKEPSSFLGYLADMEKKEEVKPEKEDVPEETEEERQKRLRKQARRKLRVSWKPDGDLVETKIFTHFPEEETGQTDSMMRDAGDTVREGEMLKLHKGMEDLDEDEEEETSIEELEEYSPPSEVDFSIITEDISGNFIKGGGSLQPDSPCSKAQAKHEENTVMAVFASKSDRPSTPAEPNDDSEEPDFNPTVDFGEPNDKIRAREKEEFARQRQRRQQQQQQQQYPQTMMSGGGGTSSNNPGGLNLAAALASFSAQNAAPQQQPLISDELRRALGLDGSGSQQPPAAAIPPPQSNPSAAGGPTSMDQLMALVKQAANATRPTNPPTYIPPSITQMQQPQIPPTTDLSVLLAQMKSQSQPQLQPQLPQYIPPPSNDDYLSTSRKHTRNDSHDDPYDNVSAGNMSRTTGPAKKKKALDFSNKGERPPNYKTVPCSFWKEGKCLKGDACTFKHDE